ncbi:hypothetical protein [Acaryochloris marina]|uniref:hypothetical protein n=1 Tax=Acaryochloris marina TaxID=155978 RepID=UPI001BAFFB5B|nr:hypothetical protein [Acaryochloris marina]QUY46204.1 hypothetical protein I1H34_31270 [Acaryochloris marina S15]
MFHNPIQEKLFISLGEKQQEYISGGSIQIDDLDLDNLFPKNSVLSSLFGNGGSTYVQKNEVKEVGENSSANSSVSQSRTIIT